MIGILIAVLLAALVYWLCLALGLPAIVGIVAAILVLIAGVGTGGYGTRLVGGRPLAARRPGPARRRGAGRGRAPRGRSSARSPTSARTR